VKRSSPTRAGQSPEALTPLSAEEQQTISNPKDPSAPADVANPGRRLATAKLGQAAGVAVVVGTSAHWAKPVIDSVILPAHAVTSGNPLGVDPGVSASCSRVERHRDRVVIQDANWADSLFIPQFDASTGALQSVEVEWTAELNGGINLENTEDRQGESAGNLVEIGARVAAEMSLAGPGGASFGMVTPEVIRRDDVTGFDGNVDYSGESGRSYDSVTFEKTTTLTFTDQRTLNMFTGQGAVEFFAQSVAVSRSFGSANLIAQIDTRSGMRLKVTYACS